jgi:hypothetical protein
VGVERFGSTIEFDALSDEDRGGIKFYVAVVYFGHEE